jgi:hypothetical protein
MGAPQATDKLLKCCSLGGPRPAGVFLISRATEIDRREKIICLGAGSSPRSHLRSPSPLTTVYRANMDRER